ncbi:hypothetical protein ID853_08260 [Xenorhabdus sp. Vera]|uniref:hypothetical protein n=1 Tax=Xenorhabdus koppenhoeferi TaxID=351659 RepID=UPI001990A712|nr:hypothetical protein [Xenorhabdus sp. Vera]MBD2810872.1 hypothetical protein [Xenorhabdus sp. Vera]
MFKLIITITNQHTGETKKETVRYRYKTLRGAEKAANNIRSVSIPDGEGCVIPVSEISLPEEASTQVKRVAVRFALEQVLS